MAASSAPQIWLAAGVRTPFAKIDGPLASFDAIALSVPLAEYMVGLLDGAYVGVILRRIFNFLFLGWSGGGCGLCGCGRRCGSLRRRLRRRSGLGDGGNCVYQQHRENNLLHSCGSLNSLGKLEFYVVPDSTLAWRRTCTDEALQLVVNRRRLYQRLVPKVMVRTPIRGSLTLFR